MAVVIKCPSCAKTYRIAEDKHRGRVRCKQCGHVFSPIHSSDNAPRETRDKAAPDQATGMTQTSETAPFNPRTIGRFQIQQQIGSGAFGAVYLAWDPLLERQVAVKVPRNGDNDDNQAASRFEREAKAAAQLQHPNIVPVYDAGIDDGRHFIASMFVLGRTLRQAVAEEQIDLRQRVEIVMKLADALHYAHQHGIVHRDVKPANVMLDDQDEPHLLDFGLAAWVRATEKLTTDGTVVGTPAYLSPEQAGEPGLQVGPASDQFSLGVVLYELLCGQRPFVADDFVVLLYQIRVEEPKAPRNIDPSLPSELESICLRAMAKRPSDRYADCGELAGQLQEWLEGKITIQAIGPIQTSSRVRRPRKSAGRQAVAWYRRKPLVASLIGGMVLLILVVVILLPKTGGDGGQDKVATPTGERKRPALATDGAEKQRQQSPVEKKLSGVVGQWLTDGLVRVRIPHRIEGMLLRDQDYVVTMDIENLVSKQIDIARIELDTYNAEAASILDLATPQVHTSVIQVTADEPLNLAAHQHRTLALPINRILPASATIKIFHNGARSPSQFKIEGLSTPRAAPAPRQLPPKSMEFRLDGLHAIETAKEKAMEWSADAILSVAFTVDRKVVEDPESGLQVVVPKSWLVQFFSPSKGATFNVGIDDGSMNSTEIPDNLVDCERTISPRLTLQQAIELASKNDLLCANWNGHSVKNLSEDMKNPRLRQVRLGGHRTYAWMLPYLGPDSAPVVIDAITGDRLQRSERVFRRVTLEDKSLLEVQRRGVTWNMPLRNLIDRMLVGGWDCSLGRLLYNDAMVAFRLGGQHHVVVGWGLTVDGTIHVIRFENNRFSVQQFAPTRAEELGATIKSVSRTFDPEEHETTAMLARLNDGQLRFVLDGEHQIVKGHVTCTVERDVEIRELILVMSMTGAAGEKVRNLKAKLVFKGDRIRAGKLDVQFDTSTVDTKIDWAKGVQLYLTAFVLADSPAVRRISNELHCLVQ